MNHSRKKLIVYLTVLFIIVIASAVAVLLIRNKTEASTTPGIPARQISMFKFTGAENWRQGPANKTSMALFNSTDPKGESPCFTSTEFYNGDIDEKAQLLKSRKSLKKSGHTVKSLGTKTLSIRTNTGNKKYTLHLSQVSSPKGTIEIMGGNAIGYLQLSNGYLKIYGNCNSAEDLPNIYPALQAVTMNSAK